MKVEDVYFIKRIHQRLPHSPKGGVIEVAVVCDEPENAFADLVNLPLSKSDELDIVILKPLGVFLAKRFPIHHLVGLNLILNPVTLVG